MGLLEFEFADQALHFPGLRLWFDAHRRRRAGELVVVSHAHSDHTGAHAEVIFSPPTQRLMRSRVGGKRVEHVLEFGVRTDLRDPRFGVPREAHLTVWPAGHVLGSAMALLEAEGSSLLYTGDFKLRPGLSSEVCQPVPADVLVMETTFGLLRYVLPPSGAVQAGLRQFARATLAKGQVPVLLGYSLGKAQEILASLAGVDAPIMVHQAIETMTTIYAEFGRRFPNRVPWTPPSAAGHVVIAPPGAALKELREHHPALAVAAVTGWALDASCQYRYRAQAAFPLSDHADYPELLAMVQQVQPKRIYTLHGFAGEFATDLRRLGYDARALTEIDQFELPLEL